CSLRAEHGRADSLAKNHTCHPFDCSDVYEEGITSDGVYLIYPAGPYSNPVSVYCDMSSSGGPWTVFQKRFDGSVNFFRGWREYQSGFGQANKEYWLGLHNIYLLTLTKPSWLRIDLEDFENNTRFATYKDFSLSRFAISPEEDGYRLNIAGFEEGDSFGWHNGMPFSTFDNDRDNTTENCANSYKGGFWYRHCHASNLNGRYLGGHNNQYAVGLVWNSWKGHNYSLKRSEMKIARSKP
uniref:Microfibril-associated glycoprotein 4-like n=1 Tax=Xenopus tropicalis TaxID=8364 RepID=F7E204_XENTR